MRCVCNTILQVAPPHAASATGPAAADGVWRRVWLVAMPRHVAANSRGGRSGRQHSWQPQPREQQRGAHGAAAAAHAYATAAAPATSSSSSAMVVGCDLLGFALPAEGEEAGSGSSSTDGIGGRGRGSSSCTADGRYARLLFRLRLDAGVVAAESGGGVTVSLGLKRRAA